MLSQEEEQFKRQKTKSVIFSKTGYKNEFENLRNLLKNIGQDESMNLSRGRHKQKYKKIQECLHLEENNQQQCLVNVFHPHCEKSFEKVVICKKQNCKSSLDEHHSCIHMNIKNFVNSSFRIY